MRRIAWLIALNVLVCACSNKSNGAANVLPDVVAETGNSQDVKIPDDGLSDDCSQSSDADTCGYTPRAYRFTSLTIVQLGDQKATDTPAPFHLAFLQGQWAEDVKNFRLNILLLVDSLTASEAKMRVASGVGESNVALCLEGSVTSGIFAAKVDDLHLNFGLGVNDRIFIYSADDERRALNCSLDDALPDALPLSAVSGTADFKDDSQVMLSGTISTCLTVEETKAICTVLMPDNRTVNAECLGCPHPASTPLWKALDGVGATKKCKDILGSEGYLIQIAFDATYIGSPPSDCAEPAKK